MTPQEVIKNLKKLKSFHNGSYGTAIDHAIKALEQQPSEDAISREVVLDVMPQRPKGKWIIRRLVNPDTMNKDIRIFECSECRTARRESITDHGFMNYCPNCGSSMKYER